MEAGGRRRISSRSSSSRSMQRRRTKTTTRRTGAGGGGCGLQWNIRDGGRRRCEAVRSVRVGVNGEGKKSGGGAVTENDDENGGSLSSVGKKNKEEEEEEEDVPNSMMSWLRNGVSGAVREFVPGGGTEMPFVGLIRRMTNPYGGDSDETVTLPEFARRVERSLSAVTVRDEVVYDYNRALYELRDHYGARDTTEKHVLFCAWLATVNVVPNPEPTTTKRKSRRGKSREREREREGMTPVSIVNKLRISQDIELESERAMAAVEEKRKRRRRWMKRRQESPSSAEPMPEPLSPQRVCQERAELAAALICVRLVGYNNTLLETDARNIAVIASTVIDTEMSLVDLERVEARALQEIRRCNADSTMRTKDANTIKVEI